MAALACLVSLPPNALTATGLSTPWTVTGCDQTVNPTFAECVIVDAMTGTLSVYSPLLVNKGAVVGVNFLAPTVPTLPTNSVVGCWFGTNGATTTLTDNNNGADVKAANCIGVLGQMQFGQFAACNAVNFFTTANQVAMVPPLATGLNGLPCYTTRSFQIIDMDPSDNVVTAYTMAGAVIAQKTAANIAKLQAMTGATPADVTNGSDNLLLDAAYRPALGCQPFTAPNLADPAGPPVGALGLNELQAAVTQMNQALIPPTDPFVVDLNNGALAVNLMKQNTYRVNVNQPPGMGTGVETMAFCQNMLDVTAMGYIMDIQFLIGKGTPDAANGIDLFTFLGQRFQNSWKGLTCNALITLTSPTGGMALEPITANRNGNGVTVSLTFNTMALVNGLLGQFMMLGIMPPKAIAGGNVVITVPVATAATTFQQALMNAFAGLPSAANPLVAATAAAPAAAAAAAPAAVTAATSATGKATTAKTVAAKTATKTKKMKAAKATKAAAPAKAAVQAAVPAAPSAQAAAPAAPPSQAAQVSAPPTQAGKVTAPAAQAAPPVALAASPAVKGTSPSAPAAPAPAAALAPANANNTITSPATNPNTAPAAGVGIMGVPK
ncbi:hypothetical protein BC830DRAFT_1227921 [Chytriomyces sp. MP71]|nr:hypothetical protein BC830DRAFT_1227921 [Chytriomyces sp. MP71]